jgi:hypothetical protein
LTHPVVAGQGLLIFLCKAAGAIALLSALGLGRTGFHPGSSGFPVHGLLLHCGEQARTALAQLVSPR